jgi:hypothetical protein
MITIFRPGAITFEALSEVTSSLEVDIKRQESVASPGHLKHYYMLKKPLIIANSKE